MDDEEEVENDDGNVLQMDASEQAAIASSNVQKYTIPRINFEAEEYPDLIDWKESNLYEPPMTLSLTNDQLMAIKDSPLPVPNYPCHTQAVERAVLFRKLQQASLGKKHVMVSSDRESKSAKN